MTTFRIEDPELDFGNFGAGTRFGNPDVRITIKGWIGCKCFEYRTRVPAEYVGAEPWPHILRDMRFELIKKMTEEAGPMRFTIASGGE